MKKKNIFERRVNILPYEYPSLLKYKDAIRHSYWIDTEYNFTTDINDYKVNISDVERSIIKKTMLAISQIEVNVKTFWADMYKRMPITEIGDVGMTFAECHGEGTEILTLKGWVNFKDIDINTEVIQYDLETNTMTSVLPSNVINEPYKGKMHRIKNQTYNALLTPNHSIYYKTRSCNIIKKPIKDITKFSSDMKLPFSGKLVNGGFNKLSTIERLRIAIQADGSARFWDKNGERVRRGLGTDSHTYEISVKKERKKLRLKNLILESGLTYREFEVLRPEYVKYEIDFPIDYDLKQFDWVDLSDKSQKWCEDFIEELIEWDGTKLEGKGNAKNCLIKYYTTNKSCADKVQAIGVLAGYRTNLNTSTDTRKYSYKDVYTISFVNVENYSSITYAPTIEDYDGNIYCVTVPTGCIVTRYNDKVLISGNSEVRHKDAYARLLRILGLEDEFRTVVEIPAIRDRIAYLSKYLDGTRSRDDKMYTKSVLLFSLFIEHVSLFSQFLIMMSFNKERNIFKGISNVVEATSKEEDIHGNFGAEIINIVKEENPEWFDDEFNSLIYSACQKAYKSECKILDWIFEDGELEFLPKETIKHFIMNRFNNSLNRIQMDSIFEVDKDLLKSVHWFDLEITSTKEGDFFYKRQIDYSKKTKSITEDDLF
jgi:ribonucleotide reductase beta subunit family protein with ferritin-like domain